MSVDFVADIGNSRIKWGRCDGAAVSEIAALPLHDPAAWQRQLGIWEARRTQRWCVAGVNPQRRDFLVDWLRQQFSEVRMLHSPAQLPLRVAVPQPEGVGIDRLLNAVAVNSRRHPQRPAVVVDAGSAVTVNLLDENGTFRGGSIFPGIRLMTEALHNCTALLPLVSITSSKPPAPADSTRGAIEAGVFWAVVGGANTLIARMTADKHTEVYLAGGDALLLAPAFEITPIVWQEMTLEGIRIAAD